MSLYPNSHGEPLALSEWEFARLVESGWSAQARQAAAEARRRRKTIGKLKDIRVRSMNKLMDQLVKDSGMHRNQIRGKGISKAAQSFWKRANDAGMAIQRLSAMKPTQQRPLLSRLQKGLKRYF